MVDSLDRTHTDLNSPCSPHTPNTQSPQRFAELLIASFLKTAGQIVRDGDELYVALVP